MTSQGTQILAIDAARRTGWAHSDGAHGAWNLHGSTGDRLIQLYVLIRDEVLERGADLIAVEAAIFHTTNKSGAIPKIYYNAAVFMAAAASGVDVREYAPTSIKFETTGSGKSNKKQMIAAVEQHYGVRTDDDNVADAVAILEMARRGIPGIGERKPLRIFDGAN